MAYTEQNKPKGVCEVRATGAKSNGGYYDGDDYPGGMDYTQQDAAQLTLTDLATSGAGVNIVTSVTGGFTANMVGNAINITSGTNFDVGADGTSVYYITGYTNGNTVTVDRSPTSAGAGSGGNGKVGGARASVGGASSNQASGGGTKIWVKGGAYTTASTTVNIDGGVWKGLAGSASAGPTTVRGYSTTRGDKANGTRVTVTAAVGATMFDGTNGGCYVADVDVTMGTTASSVGFAMGSNTECAGCVATACVTGFRGTPGGFVNCLADTCTNGFGDGTTQVTAAFNCWARNCTSVGFTTAGNNSIMGCIASGCGSYGFTTNNSGMLVNCTAVGNGNSGFWRQSANGARATVHVNCLSAYNTNYGFEDAGGIDVYLRNCATVGNTVARSSGITSDVGPITLSGDPFMNRSGGDFRLAANYSGNLCRDGGSYNTFPGYSTLPRNQYVGGLATKSKSPVQNWPNVQGWPGAQ